MKALKKSEPDDILVVMRFGKRGDLKMSKPCIHCQEHIRKKKISEVWYSDENGCMQRLVL